MRTRVLHRPATFLAALLAVVSGPSGNTALAVPEGEICDTMANWDSSVGTLVIDDKCDYFVDLPAGVSTTEAWVGHQLARPGSRLVVRFRLSLDALDIGAGDELRVFDLRTAGGEDVVALKVVGRMQMASPALATDWTSDDDAGTLGELGLSKRSSNLIEVQWVRSTPDFADGAIRVSVNGTSLLGAEGLVLAERLPESARFGVMPPVAASTSGGLGFKPLDVSLEFLPTATVDVGP